MVLQKDKLFTMNVSDCILKGFEFPWRDFSRIRGKRERKREGEKGR